MRPRLPLRDASCREPALRFLEEIEKRQEILSPADLTRDVLSHEGAALLI